MLNEFKAFIARGNVLDLAVAVIIGGAFGTIVTSLTDDVIMPVISAIFGGVDFTSHFIQLGATPADYARRRSLWRAMANACNTPCFGATSAIVSFRRCGGA